MLGTQWAVFEPNDIHLWMRIQPRHHGLPDQDLARRRALRRHRRRGLLCEGGRGENPVETRDVGQLIIEVGIAPVKPAEFVIIRLSQWQPGG